MFFSIHLCAPNDTNGNPRRVYVVYECDGEGVRYVGAVDEGYGGRHEIWRTGTVPWGAHVSELESVGVTPREYRETLQRDEWRRAQEVAQRADSP